MSVFIMSLRIMKMSDMITPKVKIFPVNNMGRGRNEEEIAERIRHITGRSEIPARWFLFQIELKSKTKE